MQKETFILLHNHYYHIKIKMTNRLNLRNKTLIFVVLKYTYVILHVTNNSCANEKVYVINIFLS